MSIVKFPKFFSKVVCTLLSFSLAVPGFMPVRANAQALTCNAWSADNGSQPQCGAVRIGGIPVSYPKLQWTWIGDVEAAKPTVSQQPMPLDGDASVSLANRAALALGRDAAEVASAVAAFPANVPYVFGRYNQLDGTLRIDIFKLEKTRIGTSPRTALYHAQFGPAHGDYWKAARAYIAPDQFMSGLQAGVNPFESFKEAGTDLFRNISFEAAQVAMGHAMRLVGSPLGVFAMSENRLSSTTTKGGNAFIRKTTVRIYGHAKPRWYIAQPMNLLKRPTTNLQAAFCARDPTATECQLYATATAGVSFEEFDGGTLSSLEDTWLLEQKTKRGLGVVGALFIMVVASFAIGPMLNAIGIGAGTGAGTAGGVAMGQMGAFLYGQGLLVGMGQFGFIVVETAWMAAQLVLAGANMSSTINLDSGLLLGRATVQKGTFDPDADLSEHEGKISARVTPLVTSNMAQGPGNTLVGFSQTVMGTCSPGSTLASCPGATGGMIVRADQYAETNEVMFVRDNDGTVLRDDHDPQYKPGATQP